VRSICTVTAPRPQRPTHGNVDGAVGLRPIALGSAFHGEPKNPSYFVIAVYRSIWRLGTRLLSHLKIARDDGVQLC
jgi:hypothetical protein